ncbi:MAG: sulfide-dependent adenosine diphosphate thiazole synthase [Candidatus Margulisiibacteriota bacterium]
MKLDDIIISKQIIESFSKKLVGSLESDVAIAGGGPAGLVAAYYLAKAGKKVVLFERKLSVGGGRWGGGMMFNEIVLQKEGTKILKEFGVRFREKEKGYFLADSIETVGTLASKAVKAGATVFNLISVEDVMIRGPRVTGLVLTWTAVEMAGLHVDPLTIRSKFVVDATGHPAEIANIIVRKIGPKLKTKSGKLLGEKSMWAEVGEKTIVQNTKEVYPGVYVCGMACNAVFGAPRMGPIFGGMLLSGKKAAELLIKKLK